MWRRQMHKGSTHQSSKPRYRKIHLVVMWKLSLPKDVKHLGHGQLNIQKINSTLSSFTKLRSPSDHCTKAAQSHCCSSSQKPHSFSDLAEIKFVQQKQSNSSKDERRGECTGLLQTSSHWTPTWQCAKTQWLWNNPIKFKSSTKF